MLLFTLNLAMPWDFAAAPNGRETANETAPVTSSVATVAVVAGITLKIGALHVGGF